MKPKSFFPALLLAAAAVVASAQENTFHIKSGDRVVFYGDSITDQRLYTTFTETYVVTRFPKLDVLFVHSVGVATGLRAEAAVRSTCGSSAMCWPTSPAS